MELLNTTLRPQTAHQRSDHQPLEDIHEVEQRRAGVVPLRQQLEEARASNAALMGRLKSQEEIIQDFEVAHHHQKKHINICERLLQLQDDESKSVYHQDGWERFEEAVQCLNKEQIDDGIKELEKMRLQLCCEAERSQKTDLHRTSMREKYTLGDRRHISSSDAKREDQIVNDEKCHNNLIANIPEVEARKELRQQRQQLKVKKSIQNLSSAGVRLGGRVMSLFGKSPKEKSKNLAVNTIFEESKEDHPEEQTTGSAAPTFDTQDSLVHQPCRRPSDSSRCIISGSHHPNVRGYNLQEAQGDYQTSTKNLQVNAPKIQINGVPHASKESQELEKGIMSRLEDEYGEIRPTRGTVASFDFPEGSRERDGAVFRQGNMVDHPTQLDRASSPAGFLRRTDQFVFSQSRSQGNGLILMPVLSPRSRLSLPAGKVNRMARVYGPPTAPPPDRPLPTLPRRLPTSTACSPLRRVQNIDDVDNETSVDASSRTRNSSASATTTPAYPTPAEVTTRRASAPSPAISTGSNRPWSPSPGGNGPLGDIGELMWMREDA